MIKAEFYLQLEYDKLIFKLYVLDPEQRVPIRDHYRNRLYAHAAKASVVITQYGRLGRYMGVARLQGDYRAHDENGILDMDSTLATLREMQRLIENLDERLV
ncbi:hypothetical protein G3480_26795 [Thiorhodococcus mannitoliphagus]|uniref:Uncharacterized protein n=2 Tax=Thiorhodococcus mannitoliphagus TaxID=329406 RepID=A0A6P1E5P4_9GAMM|nr:hypothetical protein [Thiorhodococcus mannitoliphagus]